MKFSILFIIVIISVGLLFSVLTDQTSGFLLQFLVAMGLFVLVGFFAILWVMKKTKDRE